MNDHGRGLDGLRLIVNADDFGLADEVNLGVRRAHLSGVVTSTSIMPNGRAFARAVEIARHVPTLEVGIHLTLVEELPLSDPRTVSSLVDGTGHLHRDATTFTWRYFGGLINLNDVRTELEAQIRTVVDHGIRPSHLDSHQHLHMLPKVLSVVVDLARRHRIPFIRLPKECGFRDSMSLRSTARHLGRLALNAFCLKGRRHIPLTTDHFRGFLLGGRLDRSKLLDLIAGLPPAGSCELICHPATAVPAGYEHWKYESAVELAALIDPAVIHALRARSVSLVSRRDLHVN